MAKDIQIIGDASRYSKKLLKKVEDMGYTVVTVNTGDIVGIILNSSKINLNDYKKLKVISRYGVGIDNVDLDKCEERGIKVYNTPGIPSESVAELAMIMILTLLRNNKEQLYGKSVGIIGYGNIGSRLAKLLEGFDCNIFYYDPYYCPVTTSHINTILYCDIISIHTPLTKETKRLIDRKLIYKMKNKPIIINTSRKDIVSEASIIEALDKGLISGFGSDVNDKSKFKKYDNVLITSHIGSNTIECIEEMGEATVNNLIEGLNETKSI